MMGMMALGWLVFVAGVVGSILLAVWLIRRYGSTTASAHTILDERFARGEIDQAEYVERRAGLQSKHRTYDPGVVVCCEGRRS